VIRALARSLEGLLLPNACVVCNRVAPARAPQELVCGVCRSRLTPVHGGCRRCQHPHPPVGPCRFCHEWPSALRTVRSALWLDAGARTIVHHLKYEELPDIAMDVAPLLARAAPRPATAVLVPVPLAERRLRLRGFNQATALARALGVLWGCPVAERLLRRVRETGTQTALQPAARLGNVAGAFRSRPPHAGAGGGTAPTVILVDDVLTTGATLVACATAMSEAGWPAVHAVTFARALPYERRVP